MKTINVKKNGGVVHINVEATRYPQSITGVVWKYDSAKKPLGKAGDFNSHLTTFPLGSPAECDQLFFMVDGVVVQQGDNPATPYQVTVSITQDGQEMYSAIPDNGSGQLSDANQYFIFKFQLIEQ